MDTDSEDELPSGWEERVAHNGQVYYVNHLSKSTQWSHPRTNKRKQILRDLPLGWERLTQATSDGKPIYFNAETNIQTTTDPRLAYAIEETPTIANSNLDEFRQRFDASSTALQVLNGKDLTGKIAVITGANSGIGYETAFSLVKHRCKVVFACRNLQLAHEAIERIATSLKHISVRELCLPLFLDLTSFRSVEQFVFYLNGICSKLDVVIMNAGVFGNSYNRTLDGFESMFQVNHLSHMYLAVLLLRNKLLQCNSRLILVSSESHRFANLTVQNAKNVECLSPSNGRNYWHFMQYNNSKLCNLLCARKLAKLWQTNGISVFSVHPGNMVCTNLARKSWFYQLIFRLISPFTKSLQQAASTSVYCATAEELTGITGVYFNNCFPCEESEAAKNDDLMDVLWRNCCKMIVAQRPEAKQILLPDSI